MAEITKEGFLLKQQLIEEAKKGQQEKKVTFALYEQKYKFQNALPTYLLFWLPHPTGIIQFQH